MVIALDKGPRAFTTAWFTKAARKAHIDTRELCEAWREAMLGQVDDLGGGVFKKRLGGNRHRSIVLAKGGSRWVYQYLFAKQDRANIGPADLADFRILARAYASLDAELLEGMITRGDLTEICHDVAPVQE